MLNPAKLLFIALICIDMIRDLIIYINLTINTDTFIE